MKRDHFGALDTLDAGQGPVSYYRLRALERAGLAGDLDRLPFSIKVLLESVLRNLDGELVTEPDVRRLAAWNAARPAEVELPFMELTPLQRLVFEMREVEGRPTEEVAEILSLPPGTVRVHLHRARMRLRARLSQHFKGAVA